MVFEMGDKGRATYNIDLFKTWGWVRDFGQKRYYVRERTINRRFAPLQAGDCLHYELSG